MFYLDYKVNNCKEYSSYRYFTNQDNKVMSYRNNLYILHNHLYYEFKNMFTKNSKLYYEILF